MIELWRVAAVCIAAIFGGLGPVYFKKASTRFSLSFDTLKNLDLYIACIAYGLATILFIPALNGGDLSVLYPLVGTSNVWACIFAIKFLDEKMSKRKWAGVSLIIIGLALIGLGS